jgi:hypothetical protein
MRVGGDDVNLGISFLEFGIVLCCIFNFGRAVEGEGGWHENQNGPLAHQAGFGDFNEFAIVESLGFERLNLGINK